MSASWIMRAIAGEIDDTESTNVAAGAMDEEAFRAFYDRTARSLWAYLARFTGNRELADDLVQETYYRFYRAAAVHESESHRRNSLFHIATNLARDAARRNAYRTMMPIESAEPIAVRPADAGARTDLLRAIDKLTEGDRQLLWLAYAQGISHAEIATILGLRTGSIKTLLLRARKRLAKMLGGKP